MFDKYYNSRDTIEYVPFEKTVNINKAPTDESVKLLMEMEKAAKDKFIGTFQIDNNTLNIIFSIFKEPIEYKYSVYCKFYLNNKAYTFDFFYTSIDTFQLKSSNEGRDSFIKLINKKLLEKLSDIFTIEFFNSGTFKQSLKHI